MEDTIMTADTQDTAPADGADERQDWRGTEAADILRMVASTIALDEPMYDATPITAFWRIVVGAADLLDDAYMSDDDAGDKRYTADLAAMDWRTMCEETGFGYADHATLLRTMADVYESRVTAELRARAADRIAEPDDDPAYLGAAAYLAIQSLAAAARGIRAMGDLLGSYSADVPGERWAYRGMQDLASNLTEWLAMTPTLGTLAARQRIGRRAARAVGQLPDGAAPAGTTARPEPEGGDRV